MKEPPKNVDSADASINSERLDALDLRILEVLQVDAALSNQALAERVHTSPATSHRRVQRLLRQGVIKRIVALVDPVRLGPMLTVVVEVTLDRQGAEHLEAFESRCLAHPAVRQCHRVSPGPDFILIAQVVDMPAWARVVDELFTQAANVRNVKALFSVKQAKHETAAILPRAIAAADRD